MSGFDGAVLCGGGSRRMGRDKALIEVDGTPMAGRVAHVLRSAGASTVATVGGDERRLSGIGLGTRPDRWPGEGPLAGVISALRSVGDEPAVAVLACDLLAPDAHLTAQLVERRVTSGADVVVPVTDGRPQWVHAVWKRRVVGVLEDVFAAGERSLVGAVIGLCVELFEVDEAWRLADADRPSDLPTSRA